MAVLTLAELDRFATPRDRADSVGALACPADLLGSDDDELSGVESDDLLCGALADDDELGWGWGSIKRGFKKGFKAVRSVTRSKVFRLGMAGVAIAFPIAAPAVVALEAANKVAAKLEAGSKEAREAIKATQKAAAKGDKGAQRALKHIKVAVRARKLARSAITEHRKTAAPAAPARRAVQPPGPAHGVLILADGQRLQGRWVRG